MEMEFETEGMRREEYDRTWIEIEDERRLESDEASMILDRSLLVVFPSLSAPLHEQYLSFK